MLGRLKNLPQAMQQTLIYAAALGLSKAFALVMVPVATRFLTPADYGRLDVLQTLADLLSIVIGMGLAETLFRFAGSADDAEKRKQAAANVFGLAISIGFIALLITQLVAGSITALLPGGVSELQTRIILTSLSLVGIVLVPLAWLRLQSRPWRYLIGTAGRVGMQALLGVLLLVLGYGVTGVLVAGLISAVVLSSWLAWSQWKETGISFDFSRFRSFSMYGGPLIFVGIAGFILGSFDRWILADQIGTAAMAEYAVAAKFGLITAVLIQPFDLWWHSRRFAYLEAENGAITCGRYGAIGIILALFAALIIAAIGPALVRLMTPESYHGAIAYIPWLAGLAAIHNINSTLGFGSMTCKDTRWPAIIDGSAAAIALLFYFWLIPLWGSYGAIAATSVALTLRLLATYLISQRLCQIAYPQLRLTLMAALTLAGLWLMPQQPLSLATLLQSLFILAAFLLAAVSLGLVPLKRSGWAGQHA